MWKVIKYHESGCERTEVQAPEGFARFVFDEYEPKRPKQHAELIDEHGNIIATKPN